MVETRILVFLALMAGVAAAIPFAVRRLRRRSEEQVLEAIAALESAGHVVEGAVSLQGRPFVRIWGLLEHPVALELHVRRRGLLGRLLPRGGVGPIDAGFERVYRVVTSEPDRARLILDPDAQQRLTRLAGSEFRLGSAETLLPPDYWSALGPDADRRLRRLWMIHVPGKRDARRDLHEHAAIGAALARSVSKHCLPPGTADRSAFETRRSEAPWL